MPDGGSVIVQDMGGVFRCIVRKPAPKQPGYEFDGLAHEYVPMLFSGVIEKAIVKSGEGVKIKLTEMARRRLAGYSDNLPAKEQELQRFVIRYADEFSYFEPKITGIYTFTQYVMHRPTWYSGTMAAVVQVVGGYGRQNMGELPDDDIERARMVIPEKYMTEIRAELLDVRLPGYTGFPDIEGQFRYDYKFNKCHGISFDESGAPWLIQVSASGVYAMPLPLIPATTTKAFRQYVEDSGDDELVTLIDQFGGLPSGESFPDPGEDFEAWRRAGVIVKVCDTVDFYDHQPFYDACGWAFNSKGTEGFNTCWDYRSDGLIEAYAYKMKLKLSPAKDHGVLRRHWDLVSNEQANRLNSYLSWIYRQIRGNSAKELAIKYKIWRHSVTELLSLASQGADINYWDSLEMDPIASHNGSVSMVSQGPIYWPRTIYPQSMGRLKFPALTGEGCESFIMVSPDYRGDPVRCDTIVFGCYVDDSLRVVKYFYDDREFYREEESTFEEPMIVGMWEETKTFGMTGLMGYFYTTDFDDRQEAPDIEMHTEVVGEDLGYGNPIYKTPPLFFRVGTVHRFRYYTHTTRTRTTEGFSLDVAICVPVFSRDCILYAYKESTTGWQETESAKRYGMADPTSYQLWTNDDIFHRWGETENGNKGIPYPREGEYVYIDTMGYNPTEYSDFADSGDWLGLGGNVIDVSGLLAQYTSRANNAHYVYGVTVGGEAPQFKEYSWEKYYPGDSSGRISVCIRVAGAKVFSRDMPSKFYYDFSPVEAGGSLLYFYRDAIHNAIGSAEYASIYEKDASGLRVRWGNTSLADHKSAHHFIGVINE